MSGKSNVLFWLQERNVAPKEETVNRIFEKAKSSKTVLAEKDIYQLCEGNH